MDRTLNRPSVAPAGIMLGIGLGGFFDGILLHQILQWHNMLSAKLPPNTMENMRTGMTADGFFHVVTWAATLIGVALLWNTLNRNVDFRPAGVGLVGYMLAGWGWLNLIV